MPETAAAPALPRSVPGAPLSPRAAWVFAGLTLAGLWFVLCRHLASEWAINEQYSYGWFVPFFALFLFWLRWEERGKVDGRKVKGERPLGSDLLLSTSAFLLFFTLLPVRLFEIGNPDWRPLGWVHAGVVVGLTFLFLGRLGGWAFVRHFAFPVCFIFVSVPWISGIEMPVIQGLMRAVAAVAAETLNLFGIPAQLEGNLIRVSSGLVGVNEACSGVRSLQTSLMIGLLFGELKRLSVARRAFLLGGAVAIALLANCVRALFLVWLAASDQTSAVGRWHDLAGYSIVGAVFLGTMALAAALEERRAESPEASPPHSLPHFLLSPFPFLLSLLWLLAVEAGAEGWYRLHERQLTPESAWTVRWPEQAPGFREIEIDEGVRRTLRYDAGREAAWLLPKTDDILTAPKSSPNNAATCLAFFFRWEAGGSSVLRARAHRPDICLPNAGWDKLADRGSADFAVGALQLPFRRVTFQRSGGGPMAYTYFCLQEDQRRLREERPDLLPFTGTQPDWSIAGRWRTVRNGVRNLGQQVLEIVLVAPPGSGGDAEAVDREFAGVLRGIVAPAPSR